ncbi:cytochrome c oxidase subunit II [bacterium]|nr:MAG: cytochrome c oxidase subunit II [bacterium]
MDLTDRIIRRIYLVPALAFFAASSAFAGENVPDFKAGWDELWRELMIDITLIGIVFAAITLYLLIRYRRRRSEEAGKGPVLSPLAAFGWVLIPVFVFMADDFFLAAKNFELWNSYRKVPANSYVVEVEGYMWSWDFKHPDGTIVTNELRVAAGRPVHVKLRSRDVVHSFFIPDYRVKWDAVPGKENYLWFLPKEPGEHVMTCTEFCGALHSGMYAKIIAMPPAEFDKWLAANKAKGGTQ